jgi:hypothetical protein
MKHPLAYYLLLLYTLAVFKPLLPAVRDGLAHVFWEHQHLNVVHHQHGTNHLDAELKEAAQDTTDSTTLKNTEPVSLHLGAQYHVDFAYSKSPVPQSYDHAGTVLYTFLEIHIPPPKV